jgi:DNA-binding response OmpR family regulator
MATQILVVDDDPLICKGLKFNLEQAGYEVTSAMTSDAALDHLLRRKYQAAILDIGLPGEDGLSFCRHIKEIYHLPVIFLTARRRELDEIVALEIGGDDYITKPFSLDLLLAHLKAVLRRSEPVLHADSTLYREQAAAGDFRIDRISHSAQVDNSPLDLSPREFDLLDFFVSHPGRVFKTDEIIDSVWGTEYVGEPQVLYVQVRSLREKIEPSPSRPVHILTVRGVGYKFIP